MSAFDYPVGTLLYAGAPPALLDALERKDAEIARWQPIETAPTDGSEFLASKPGIGPIVARILDTDHPDCEFDGGVHEAWSHQYVDGVTHWMPLPAAPALTTQTEQREA